MLAAVMMVVAGMAWGPGVASADYEQVGNFAQNGAGLPFRTASGAAVNVDGVGGVEAGSLYVGAANRVYRYSPTGEMKEVWGWNTIASGPDLPNQVSTLTMKATSGTFELTAITGSYRGEAVEGSNLITGLRLEGGTVHVGDLVEGNGIRRVSATGNLAAGSNTATSVTETGTGWKVGMAISGPGIPAETTVTGVSSGALTLSKAATEASVGASLTGGTRIAAIGENRLELSVPAGNTNELAEGRINAVETTAPVSFGASAATLKAALVSLPAFEASDLTVTGGPGDVEGTSPYHLTFEGTYAGTPVNMTPVESTLAGGVPSSSAAITTSVAASTPGFQRCDIDGGDRCSAPEGNGVPPRAEEGVGRFQGPRGIAVDQTTGYVYVLNFGFSGGREHNLIEVFSADGSQTIARFGDFVPGQTPSESPEKIHSNISNAPAGNGITVDGEGVAYVGDGLPFRVMCFRPESPGEYHHYEYCGPSHDLESTEPKDLAVDEAGHIFVASQELIEERPLDEPSAPPLCASVPKGQLSAMTANARTGEVFYYNQSGSALSVYRLKPCDPGVGAFEEAQARIKSAPPAQRMIALAVNPTLAWGANRSHGVLYGIDQGPNGGLGNGGYIFAPVEVHPPAVLAESVSGTRTASAILHGEIDPRGFATHYAFQYESDAQYQANPAAERFAGASEAPAGGGQIGSGAVGQVAAAITGLGPDTAYRFRLVASSECDEETGEPCVVEGEALSFATYPLFPPGLPDHRAYELVSPTQKNGGEVIPADPLVRSCLRPCKPESVTEIFPTQSSLDGEALAYMGQPFEPFEGAVNYDSYVSRRTSSGWQTTALIPATPPGQVKQLAFDPTLSSGLLGVEATGESKLEIQDTSEPSSTTSLVAEPNHRTAAGLKLSYAGHSADFSRIFFSANDSLTEETAFAPEPPDPGTSGKDLYEWHEGKLSLVNVLPGGAAVAAGATLASPSPDAFAISESGSRVYFKSEAGRLYVREGGKVTREVTHPGAFLTASPDGLRVLLSDGCLYSLASEACIDLSQGKGGFLGVLGQSIDLSHVYFVDTEALPGVEDNEAGEVAEPGKDNLYSWSGGVTGFIGTLPASDSSDWSTTSGARTAEASSEGRYLAFSSTEQLTGYDNVGPCGRQYLIGPREWISQRIPCTEAFLYDSVTDRLDCVSCNPTGEAPLGNSTLRRIAGGGAQFPQPRYLTDEGRFYFDSQESLSSRDTNEGVEDVYEYEPHGKGTCQRQAGCIFLISAGTGVADSNLIAVDETGKNVFFDTRDQLSLKDKDELLDVYDAREGGGIASEAEVAGAECQGEACQAPVSVPNAPTPASSAFHGAGNVNEGQGRATGCPKGRAKRHGKCVKKHSARHKKQRQTAKNANRGAQR